MTTSLGNPYYNVSWIAHSQGGPLESLDSARRTGLGIVYRRPPELDMARIREKWNI